MGRTLYYVNDGVPEETTQLMHAACEQRDVDVVPIYPAAFDYRPEWQLYPGVLLYRPAVSGAAQRVEQFLYTEGVATFYRRPADVFRTALNPALQYQRAGLPIPRTLPCDTTHRDLLRGFVDQLGGLPVIVKVPGNEGGIGVMRADTLPALFALIDYLGSAGRAPTLMAYVPEAIHWRLVVVGDRVVAAYRNPTEPDDFRTYASEEATDYTDRPRAALETLAVRATHLMGHDHGGVDVLEHPSGRLYLLESNFPCYFPQAQLVAGIDVAGAMVDYLLAKAERLEAERQAARPRDATPSAAGAHPVGDPTARRCRGAEG